MGSLERPFDCRYVRRTHNKFWRTFTPHIFASLDMLLAVRYEWALEQMCSHSRSLSSPENGSLSAQRLKTSSVYHTETSRNAIQACLRAPVTAPSGTGYLGTSASLHVPIHYQRLTSQAPSFPTHLPSQLYDLYSTRWRMR